MDKRIIFYTFGLLFCVQGNPNWAADPELIAPPASSKKELTLLSSQKPQLSADGRYVVFESYSPLLSTDHNKGIDVYLFDRSEKTLQRILGKDTARTNGGPSISPDGAQIAFHSITKESIKRKIPRTSQINVFDLQHKSVRFIPAEAETRRDGEALYPRFSGHSSDILFTSNSPSLIDAPDPLVRQVYHYDFESGLVTLISQNQAGHPANRVCSDPKISADGNIVIFRSAATNLISGIPPESLSTHLYYLDRQNKDIFRIDDIARGFDPTISMVGSYDMDEKGSVVVFEGRLRDQKHPSSIFEKVDLFLFDTTLNTVRLMTTGIFSSRSQSPSLSADGRYLVFVYRPGEDPSKDPGGIVVYDRPQDKWKRVAAGSFASPEISDDGSTIAYELIAEKKMPNRTLKKVKSIYVISNPFKEN